MTCSATLSASTSYLSPGVPHSALAEKRLNSIRFPGSRKNVNSFLYFFLHASKLSVLLKIYTKFTPIPSPPVLLQSLPFGVRACIFLFLQTMHYPAAIVRFYFSVAGIFKLIIVPFCTAKSQAMLLRLFTYNSVFDISK
jgi:hypothetical protein